MKKKIFYCKNELAESLDKCVDPETDKEVSPKESRDELGVLDIRKDGSTGFLDDTSFIDGIKINISNKPRDPPGSYDNSENGRYKHCAPHFIDELCGCL